MYFGGLNFGAWYYMCMVEQEVGLLITVAELVIWWLRTWNLVAVTVSVVELRATPTDMLFFILNPV